MPRPVAVVARPEIVTLAAVGAAGARATTNGERVVVSGRIITGSKLRGRARVRLTDGAGQVRYAYANPFGYYRFTNVAAGETYIFNASLKGFEFAPQVVYVTEDVNGLNFTGN